MRTALSSVHIVVALNVIAVVCRRSDRLDWMYQGGMLAKQEADQRTEEAMMSGKPVQEDESTELNKVGSVVIAYAPVMLQT